MEESIAKMNLVLAKWNPLEVSSGIAIDEYKQYVPLIIKNISNKMDLVKCLEDILIRKMGLDYNPSNKAQLKDLHNVCDRLMDAYNER